MVRAPSGPCGDATATLVGVTPVTSIPVTEGRGVPAAAHAEQQLKHCADRLADYTERVFAALHQM